MMRAWAFTPLQYLTRQGTAVVPEARFCTNQFACPQAACSAGQTACSASQQRALISSRLRSGLASSMPAACHCAASIPGAAALTTPSAQRLRAFGSRAKVGRMAMVAHAATLMCCCIAAVWHRGATTPSASSQQIMAYAHSLHSLYTPCTSQRKQR